MLLDEIYYFLAPALYGLGIKPRIDHKRYIKSAAWKRRAAFMRWKRGYTCEDCRKRQRKTTFHVHHKTYKRIGAERPGDLAVLCPTCHRKRHSRGKKKKNRIRTPWGAVWNWLNTPPKKKRGKRYGKR